MGAFRCVSNIRSVSDLEPHELNRQKVQSKLCTHAYVHKIQSVSVIRFVLKIGFRRELRERFSDKYFNAFNIRQKSSR